MNFSCNDENTRQDIENIKKYISKITNQFSSGINLINLENFGDKYMDWYYFKYDVYLKAKNALLLIKMLFVKLK